jgi:hypothetical protein
MGSSQSTVRKVLIPTAFAGMVIAGAYYAFRSPTEAPAIIPSGSLLDSPQNRENALLTKDEILEFIHSFRSTYAADYKVMQYNHVKTRRTFFRVDA